MTHTPGPWEFWKACDASPHRVYIGREIGHINIPHYGYLDPKGDIKAQQLSNARLIAAAPELLDALERIVAAENSYVEDTKAILSDPISEAVDMAKAVIQKAKGS